eukprot:3150502-Pleurochrysis_carterae.AAC.1
MDNRGYDELDKSTDENMDVIKEQTQSQCSTKMGSHGKKDGRTENKDNDEQKEKIHGIEH